MRIDQIHGSPEVEDKLAVKHQVEVEEAKEVLWGNSYMRFHERGKRKGENLYSELGRRTRAGI